MSETQTLNHPGVVGLVRRIIDYWALLGGFILIAVVLMNVLSVIGGVLWRPFPGDFELTQIGAANAAFSFCLTAKCITKMLPLIFSLPRLGLVQF